MAVGFNMNRVVSLGFVSLFLMAEPSELSVRELFYIPLQKKAAQNPPDVKKSDAKTPDVKKAQPEAPVDPVRPAQSQNAGQVVTRSVVQLDRTSDCEDRKKLASTWSNVKEGTVFRTG